jgi:p-aminobenzoyl-glutamate transporter AbgT
MRKIVQQVFWMYKSDKKQLTPYTSTVLSFVGISFLIFVSLLLVFDIPVDYVFPFKSENQILNRWVNGSIYPTIFIILFVRIYPKHKLDTNEYNSQSLKKVKNWLILIFFISLLIMTLLLYRKGVKKGFIKSNAISQTPTRRSLN